MSSTAGGASVTHVSRPVGPYASSRRAGDWVVTSGQLGVAPAARGALELVDGGLEPQMVQALHNLADVLAAEGATLADVVKATVFIVEMDEFPLVNRIGWRPSAIVLRRVLPLALQHSRSVPQWRSRPWRSDPQAEPRRALLRGGAIEGARAIRRQLVARSPGPIRPGRSGSPPNGPSGSGVRAPRPTWRGDAGRARRRCGLRRSTRTPTPD